MRSFTDFTGSEGCTVSRLGEDEMSEIGVKSPIAS